MIMVFARATAPWPPAITLPQKGLHIQLEQQRVTPISVPEIYLKAYGLQLFQLFL
jgi:hypothetical protein